MNREVIMEKFQIKNELEFLNKHIELAKERINSNEYKSYSLRALLDIVKYTLEKLCENEELRKQIVISNEKINKLNNQLAEMESQEAMEDDDE